ncbi:MAG: hypothetical protein RLY31_2979 [Bacteroidota bacterium]
MSRTQTTFSPELQPCTPVKRKEISPCNSIIPYLPTLVNKRHVRKPTPRLNTVGRPRFDLLAPSRTGRDVHSLRISCGREQETLHALGTGDVACNVSAAPMAFPVVSSPARRPLNAKR